MRANAEHWSPISSSQTAIMSPSSLSVDFTTGYIPDANPGKVGNFFLDAV